MTYYIFVLYISKCKPYVKPVGQHICKCVNTKYSLKLKVVKETTTFHIKQIVEMHHTYNLTVGVTVQKHNCMNTVHY